MWITHHYSDGAVIKTRDVWYLGKRWTVHHYSPVVRVRDDGGFITATKVDRVPLVTVRQSTNQMWPRTFGPHLAAVILGR